MAVKITLDREGICAGKRHVDGTGQKVLPSAWSMNSRAYNLLFTEIKNFERKIRTQKLISLHRLKTQA